MTLKDLLTDLIKAFPSLLNDSYAETLTGKHLKLLKDLEKVEEFSDCNFEIIDTPIHDGVHCETLLLSEKTKFKGDFKLYSIGFTPVLYSPEEIYKPIKNGACITPTIYNPETFTPYKKIVIEYSPESSWDEDENEFKDKLINLFKDILDNPKDYHVKGKKGILLRGIFGDYTRESEVSERIDML